MPKKEPGKGTKKSLYVWKEVTVSSGKGACILKKRLLYNRAKGYWEIAGKEPGKLKPAAFSLYKPHFSPCHPLRHPQEADDHFDLGGGEGAVAFFPALGGEGVVERFVFVDPAAELAGGRVGFYEGAVKHGQLIAFVASYFDGFYFHLCQILVFGCLYKYTFFVLFSTLRKVVFHGFLPGICLKNPDTGGHRRTYTNIE